MCTSTFICLNVGHKQVRLDKCKDITSTFICHNVGHKQVRLDKGKGVQVLLFVLM